MEAKLSGPLAEGWYLMSTRELEQELRRWRDPAGDHPASAAPQLSIAQALAYRDAGNLPDANGRSLRLVLLNDRPGVRGAIEARRLLYEPDFHDEPAWRRPGSAPINVVPLPVGARARPALDVWLDDGELAALESEWQATGAVEGLRIPAELRGLVFKTVLALRAAGKEISTETVAGSVARWLPPDAAGEVRAGLTEANQT